MQEGIEKEKEPDVRRIKVQIAHEVKINRRFDKQEGLG